MKVRLIVLILIIFFSGWQLIEGSLKAVQCLLIMIVVKHESNCF